ncbi:hypothetical protein Ddc_16734 [Ditylenchus destructor]|nr:hypothetical protein Ddc_16734 [Ditylenchus destructor]
MNRLRHQVPEARLGGNKFKDYSFECIYCDPKLEVYLTITREAMIRHCRIVHDVDEQIAKRHYLKSSATINDLADVNLAQIFKTFPWQERLKFEQVCQKWHYVGKNLSWTNYKVFHSHKYVDWSEERCRKEVSEIKSLFDRCGRNLRHLTLENWSPQIVLPFIRMASNVQHLSLSFVKLKSQHFRELARILPNLKSLSLVVTPPDGENCFDDYHMGLVEYFRVMSSLEYLSLKMVKKHALFARYSFVQFPLNLKYFALYGGVKSDHRRIIPWVVEGCKDLRGLRLNVHGLNEIFQIKSLTFLAMPFICGSTYNFEALTELRAVNIEHPNDEVLTAITQHCRELEHVSISDCPMVESWSNYNELISNYDEQANLLRVVSLPNICSLSIEPVNYSRRNAAELISLLIANGKLQAGF